MIEAGASFLSKLDEFGLSPESAGWLYDTARSDWRYLVASAAIDVVGRRKIYGAIIDLFEVFDFGDDLTSMDVHLVSPREQWYVIMRGAVSVSGASRARIRRSNLNGIHIEDALVYRFFAPPAAAKLERQANMFAKKAHKAAELAS
ncbi:hypothetical protein BSQ44_22860 [Aquibium oceanicum]|uniref:Uncharacterized protein n=2 Tax=Aquibium oceanicum TaxID=1670800 RepID=A0A1L3SWX2_9HYPH|nr:hypothetical protein BSQ44_22860 [Aquibium oceanicum]